VVKPAEDGENINDLFIDNRKVPISQKKQGKLLNEDL